MKRTYLLLAAYGIDQLAGDPEWFPHPVRTIGRAISRGERVLRAPDDSPAREFVSGLLLAASITASTYLFTRGTIGLAYRCSRKLGIATEILLAWTCVAARNLSQEAQAVSVALNRNDLRVARERIARIVGRDTQDLSRNEISRALIETLAESTSDGVIAPIVFMATGGVPLAMAYKAVNTLDSMIGHRTPKYFYFGKAAARLDDVANYVPARITALSIIAGAALSPSSYARTAWNTWIRDGAKHQSPNAGQPEAAMSGALQVRLGGMNSYAGEMIATPVMGAEFPSPTASQATQAICLGSLIALLGLALGVFIAGFQERRATPCK